MENRQNWAHIVRAIINPRRHVPVLLVLIAFFTVTRAQEVKFEKREQHSLVTKALPSSIQHQMQALGARMRIAGKEETVLDAQLVNDAGDKKHIHVVHEMSGMLRIEGIHDKTAVTFDGEFTHGIAGRMDEAVVDTFVLDTPEGMFYSLRNGASMVLLGNDFHPGTRTASNSAEPHYDVYVVAAPDRIRRSSTPQSRRFYFESTTGLLSSTRYSNSSGVNVETRFLDWQQVDGSAYPTSIERYEDGHLTFSINATRVTGQPQRNTATFN
jgi:hypothetical protein